MVFHGDFGGLRPKSRGSDDDSGGRDCTGCGCTTKLLESILLFLYVADDELEDEEVADDELAEANEILAALTIFDAGLVQGRWWFNLVRVVNFLIRLIIMTTNSFSCATQKIFIQPINVCLL